MKVEIEYFARATKTIEVDLPLYYEHHMDKQVIYGRIDQDYRMIIHEKENGDEFDDYQISYEAKIESFDQIKDSGLECYMKPEYKSSEKKFNDAVQRCMKFILSYSKINLL